jgi:bla regulator protein BlaR1
MTMMTTSNWLSPEVMRPAGWALLHFLWQGTALAALATVAMAPFRKASARYVVAVGVLLMMLAAPVATFSYYRNADAVLTWTASAPAAAFGNVTKWTASAGEAVVPRRSSADVFPIVVQLWLIGVAIFSLRSAGGLLLLERMRRRQSVPISNQLRDLCIDLQARLGLTRVIRYAQCQWLEAPAVIGWFRPIVFLPLTALTGLSEAQLQAVIAHELAHIKRLDSFVNAFQVVVETLLFYHPAVWWLNKRIRLEREHCCDDAAIALCGNAVEYARALTLMEEWRVAPGLAMAANRGPLSARITRLLGIGNAFGNSWHRSDLECALPDSRTGSRKCNLRYRAQSECASDSRYPSVSGEALVGTATCGKAFASCETVSDAHLGGPRGTCCCWIVH